MACQTREGEVMSDNPAKRIKDALKELCGYNERTRGGVAGDMFLGKDVFIARIRRPRIIEGQWEDISVDATDLIDAWQRDND